MYLLEPERIDYIESHGNYVKFHFENADYLARDSVKRLSDVLAGCGFVRIERSLLLNIRAILYVQRLGRGTYAFTLTSGLCLHSGARYRHVILRVLPLGHLPP
jgi:two-component system, LytTR family, response regulator